MAVFDLFKGKILEAEGGYQSNYYDSGNWTGGAIGSGTLVGTKYGISAPTLSSWLGHTCTVSEMTNLSLDTAYAIYEQNYWDKLKCDDIDNQELAEIICDHGINAGTSRAAKMIQTICNLYGSTLSVDGVVGTFTLAAINSGDPVAKYMSYKDARIYYYNYLCLYDDCPASWFDLFKSWGVGQSTTNQVFFNGWINRVNSFPDLFTDADVIDLGATDPVATNEDVKKKLKQRPLSLSYVLRLLRLQRITI